jgi:myo-inositol 2-dehydrogenase / D-chiro-inositol 1-dehydrogenase
VARTVNLGVIGTGRIGRVHVDNLLRRLSDVRVGAVADVLRDSAREVGERYGIPAVSEDPREVLDRGDLDAVLICSSTDTHADLIVAAAAAGKHIFCEKPISRELSATDRALRAVEAAGVKLQMGFNRRFDPSHGRVKEHIVNGDIGTLHTLRLASRDPAPPPMEYLRVSGGIFMDMTIHDFDMARYLAGGEVVEVFAAGGVRVDPAIAELGDLDTAVTVLRFDSGVLATIDNCRKSVYGYDQRIEAFGSEGMAVSENVASNSARLYGGDRVSADLPPYFFLERYTDSYVREMEGFVASVRDDTEPPATGADARAALLLAFAARRSADENRPVRVSEVG